MEAKTRGVIKKKCGFFKEKKKRRYHRKRHTSTFPFTNHAHAPQKKRMTVGSKELNTMEKFMELANAAILELKRLEKENNTKQVRVSHTALRVSDAGIQKQRPSGARTRVCKRCRILKRSVAECNPTEGGPCARCVRTGHAGCVPASADRRKRDTPNGRWDLKQRLHLAETSVSS